MKQFNKWFTAQFGKMEKRKPLDIQQEIWHTENKLKELHIELMKCHIMRARMDTAMKTRTASETEFKF